MTGAELLAMTLRERNVEFVATLSGNGLNPLYLACRDADIRLIDTRNEQAAAYMADAYARLTRRVGVVAVSSGIAHVNALTGIANAWFDGAPVLLITGESPSSQDDLGKFQEFDHVALARPLCKYARRVLEPAKIAYYVREALAVATSGRPGPVCLSIPVDVLSAEIPRGKAIRVRSGPGEVVQDAAGDADLVAEAARLIAEAERPVLVAGTGAFYAEAQNELDEFARLTATPVVVPIWDRGCIERPADYFLGVVGAASGEPKLLADADLVLLVGCRTDYRVGFAMPPKVSEKAVIIRIDVDAAELRTGVEPNVKLLGDPCTVLGQLVHATRRLGAKPHTAWLATARKRDAAFRRRWLKAPAPTAPPMTGRHVVDAIRPFLSEELLFLIDGGNIGQWAHMALADCYPSRWLTCGASAVVGWGLPGAIGAKLAYPKSPVLLLSGDGAFGFTVAELETSVKHSAPFVIVLADDRAWGIVVSGQRAAHGPEGVLASRMAEVDYAKLAEAFGAVGVRAETPAELSAAIAQGLAADRTTLIHVPIAILGPADQ
ncbi:MAG TPA: thiamine pyrophosphate-binding protein [Planctomycetota bacterium]|nr:thiamine pyrophosphate-binding protein [Planctomycetota bacterium]